MSNVDHPTYYGGEGNTYEVITVLRAWDLHRNFPLGNTVKYIARAGKKNPMTRIEDLEKARWYLTWEINHLKALQRLSDSETEK